MLVVSKKRYIPVTVNTMVLSNEDYYFYLHRDVYDQTVILSDQYPDLQNLKELVGGTRTNDAVVDWFHEQAPKPLHILAPYLALVDGQIEEDMELCCGILHVVTTMIHVRNFVLKPMEVRKSVSFSLSIKDEYAMAWDRFFLTAIPYVESRNHIAALMSALYQQQSIDSGQALVASSNEVAVDPQHSLTTTGKLEGISISREEPTNSPTLVANAAERRATKELLL